MQVFVKFSVGLDAVELLKQIDDLGESHRAVYSQSLCTSESGEETQSPVSVRDRPFSSVFSSLLVIGREAGPWPRLPTFSVN